MISSGILPLVNGLLPLVQSVLVSFSQFLPVSCSGKGLPQCATSTLLKSAESPARCQSILSKQCSGNAHRLQHHTLRTVAEFHPPFPSPLAPEPSSSSSTSRSTCSNSASTLDNSKKGDATQTSKLYAGQASVTLGTQPGESTKSVRCQSRPRERL